MAGIPQVITEDRASGAHVVEGSLKFDSSKGQYLQRTPTTDGNRKLWTWSGWLKQTPGGSEQDMFSAGQEVTNDGRYSRFRLSSDSLNLRQWVEPGPTLDASLVSSMKLRDPSAFFHCVMIYDVDNSTTADKVRWYINGQRVTSFSSTDYPGDSSWINSSSKTHTIGGHYDGGGSNADSFWNGHMSQVYFLDGIAAGPEEFGFTDPLTNTWRPKKYTGDFKIIPDNQLLYNVNTSDNGFDSGTSSRTYDATGRTFTTYSTPQTANPGGFGANSAHVYKSPDGAAIDWVISTDTTDRYIWTSTDGVNWTNTGVQDTDGSPQTVTTAWLAMAGGSNASNVTVTSSTAGYGSIVGHNSFYLPLDGNTPIGKDQSGNGNDWTPVGFGGSVALDNPIVSGALPILKTNEAGTVAKKGVRTDSKTYTVTASGGNYYIDGALKPTLNAYRGGSYTFDYTGATSHPFYLSSLQDGKWNSKAYSVEFNGSNQYLTHPNDDTITDWSSGDYTIELWAYFDSFAVGSNNNTHLIGAAAIDSGSESWSLGPNSSGQVVWYYWNGSQQRVTGGTITTGRWYHLAMTHSSGVIRVFIDGNLSATGGVNGTPQTSTLPLRIGKITSSSSFDGYVSNVRIVRGSAVYTSNFTPPGTTLTNITNTTFLACQDSDATTAPVAPGTITATGAAATQSKQPFLYDNNHGNFGLNLATSNTTKITIPHLAADTLYYYCNAHSGMGSSINVTTDIRKADPYAWKCFFACPYAGDEFDVSDQINCNSTASAATNWNSVQGSNGATFYNSGRYFASGGGKNINYAGKQEFNFTGAYKAFTIEFFATPSSGSSDGAPISSKGYYNSYGNWYFRFATTNGGRMNFYSYDGQSNGQNNEFQNLGCTDPNKVHHVVVQRDENNLMTFMLDGVIVGQASNVTRALDDGLQSGLTVGRIPSNNTTNSAHMWYLGYITDLRIYSGLAKYSGSVGDHVFTPPSVTPDVLPDTPSGITGKTNLTKITEGAVAFDGSGDFLALNDSSDFSFDGDFTVEAFVYQTVQADHKNIFSTEDFDFKIRGNGKIRLYTANSGTDTTQSVRLNTWTHLALVRESGTIKVYFDGVGETVSQTISSDGSSAAEVGRRIRGSQEPFDGFISNLRVVKGTALYTSDFTPPTEPLTEVTNTKLLCCQSTTSASAATVAPGTFVNDGTNYSSNNQVTGSAGLVNVDSIFDGHLRASGNPSLNEGATVSLSSDNYILWTPTTGIPYSSKVEVYCYAANGYEITNYYTFNGGTETTFTGGGSNFNANNWITVATGSGTINSIKIRITRGSGNQTQVNWYAVRVDGTILINDYNGKSIGKYDNAAATNFNPFTDDINTIRGQETGYATLNPLDVSPSVIATRGTTLSDGNLTSTVVSGADNRECVANISATSGKYYYEVMFNPGANSNNSDGAGWVADDGLGVDNSTTGGFMMIARDVGSTIIGNTGSRTNQSAGTHPFNYYPGDVMGCAIDLDSRIATWYKNGQKHSFVVDFSSRTNLNGLEFKPFLLNRLPGSVFANFGQKPFKFPPPDGFQPLNLSNVQPEKVIARPDQYVGTVLYTGTGITPAAALADTTIDTSTAYRYHRILFEGDINGGSVSEIEFYDADGVKIDASDTNNANGSVDTNGTAALAGWTAFNGTRGGANYAAGVRKDGGVGSAGFYISKDWGAGQSKTIYGVKVWGVNSYGLAGNTAGRYMKLQGSNDNSSWTDLQTWNEARYGTSWTTSSSTEVGHVSDTTSTSSQIITGLNHKPDLVWIKSRSFANNHHLFDSVRGPNNILRSSTTGQQTTVNVMTSFNRDGFTVAEATGNNATNDGGSTFVGWTWKAGGDKNTFNIDDVGYANASDVNMNVGGLNSSLYNTSRVWSSGIANSSGDFDQPATNAFNGDRSNKLRTGGNSVLVTLNFSPALTVANTIQILGEDYSTADFRYTVTVDGTTTTKDVDQGQPATFNVSGSLTQITFDNNNSSGRTYLEWIKVDGKELIDSNVTINTPSTAATGCSVGTKQGFSIIKYTGPNDTNNHTVPHGLLQEPDFIITKNLDNTFNWDIYHSSLANDAYLIFTGDATRAQGFSGRPTPTVFKTEHDFSTNENQEYIAYCWHDVPGLQKFGKYVGNASADGTFIELGFKPAIVWTKRIDAGSNWLIHDSARDPSNPVYGTLWGNLNNLEGRSNICIDMISNGFKHRNADGGTANNHSGGSYIYCAWAEAPTVNLYGSQANAR